VNDNGISNDLSQKDKLWDLIYKLEPDLVELEERRKEHVTVISLVHLVGALVLPALYILHISTGADPDSFQCNGRPCTPEELERAKFVFYGLFSLFSALPGSIAASIICYVYKYFTFKDYKKDFKKLVIKNIFGMFSGDVQYDPAGYIPRSRFRSARLFGSFNKYSGDDKAWGHIGQTEVLFSELHVSRVSGSGKNRSEYRIFDGLFFIAQFNKSFSTQMGTSSEIGGQKVHMDDPVFNKYFKIWSTDHTEAFYILSHTLMAKLVALKESSKRHGFWALDFSFVNNRIHIALSHRKRFFEPPLFKSLFEFEIYEKYWQDLALIMSIVEELSLNDRIWCTKILDNDQDLSEEEAAPEQTILGLLGLDDSSSSSSLSPGDRKVADFLRWM